MVHSLRSFPLNSFIIVIYDLYPIQNIIYMVDVQVFGEAPLIHMTITMSITFEPTCDFQQCGTLTYVDSGDSVQPPFKLRISK